MGCVGITGRMNEYDRGWCLKVLNELVSWKISRPFLHPVDPEKDHAPDYYEKIRKPIDFETIRDNLKDGRYSSAEEFKDDVDQLCQNGIIYNGRHSLLGLFCADIKQFMQKKYSKKPQDKKDQWFKKLARASSKLRDHVQNAPTESGDAT